MITLKLIELIMNRIDFDNDELETLVEAHANAVAASVESAINMENLILSTYAENEAREKVTVIAEGIVDFASEIGAVFTKLNPTQVERFKELFAAVFEVESSEEIEKAGEDLFNKSIEVLTASQNLVNYVNGN